MRPSDYYEELCREDPELRAQLARSLLKRRAAPRRRPTLEGHVVEFLKGGHHKCGVVVSQRARQFFVLDQDGGREWVFATKIVDVSREVLRLMRLRSETVEELRAIDRRREEARRLLRLRALWDVARESPGREWTLAELASLYFAKAPGVDGRAALSRALDDGRFFHRHRQRFVALRADAVARRERSTVGAAGAERRLREAAAWLRSVADGQPATPPQGAEHAIALLHEKVLFGTEGRHAHEAAELMKLAHLHGPEAAFGVLVKLGHWDEDENLDLLRHDVPVEFGSEVVAEAESCERPHTGRRARRQWLGRVYGLGDDARGCDRAISIRRTLLGWAVGVHFASPALYVPPGGRVQGEAAERGTSLHLPDRLIPMLPEAMASRARLCAEERRPALTVEARFDRRLEMRSYAIGVRRVRLTGLLRLDASPEQIAGDKRLRKLHELAEGLRRRRREAGAVVLPEPELEVAVRGKTIEVREVPADTPARLIRAELAILANTLVGEFCAKRGVPAIYRVEPAVREVVVGGRCDPVACHEQKKLMPRAVLQLDPAPHHGLGAERYVPISRPLHRYLDLLMHQQLAGVLERHRPPYSAEELHAALLRTACARELAERIEGASRRYWLLKHLEGRIGAEVEAVVLERSPRGHLVQLCECLLNVFVPTRRRERFSPGQRVAVTLSHVSARGDVLRAAGLRTFRALADAKG